MCNSQGRPVPQQWGHLLADDEDDDGLVTATTSRRIVDLNSTLYKY
jgi:hypothetical protein